MKGEFRSLLENLKLDAKIGGWYKVISMLRSEREEQEFIHNIKSCYRELRVVDVDAKVTSRWPGDGGGGGFIATGLVSDLPRL